MKRNIAPQHLVQPAAHRAGMSGLSILCILAVLLVGYGTSYGQSCDSLPDHFVFPENTGNSYSIIIDSIGVACSLDTCDEVGVFDGQRCVGAVVYDGTLPLAIVAWSDDPQTGIIDGYISGNPISVRVWNTASSEEQEVYSPFGSYSPVFDGGAYSRIVVCVETGPCDNDTVSPVVACPADVVIGSCPGDADTSITGIAQITDNCDIEH